MSALGLPLLVVPVSQCVVCHAATALAGAHRTRDDFLDDARSHLCVAIFMGLRREGLSVCLHCKDKLERLASVIDSAMGKIGGAS